MQMGEETAPRLTRLAQAASLLSRVHLLSPSQHRSSKWVHVGLFHLQGTKLDLGKQFWIRLGLESTGSQA